MVHDFNPSVAHLGGSDKKLEMKKEFYQFRVGKMFSVSHASLYLDSKDQLIQWVMNCG